MTADLLQIVDRFRRARIRLVGDSRLDPGTIGGAERIGPEVPVPWIIERRGGVDRAHVFVNAGNPAAPRRQDRPPRA